MDYYKLTEYIGKNSEKVIIAAGVTTGIVGILTGHYELVFCGALLGQEGVTARSVLKLDDYVWRNKK